VSFVNVSAVVLLLLFVHHRERIARWQQGLVAAFFAAWSAWLALPIFREARWNLAAPREWDFGCFWLWGRMAVLGGDFYDPWRAMALAVASDPSDEFSRLILHSGFWYPPPTMLLFAPLGFVSMRIALAVWYVVQAGFACGAAWLLWRMFLREEGAVGLLVAAMLLLALPPARSTAWFAQTNFMLLFFFLLLVRDRDKPRAGIFLALGAVVKPYFLLLLGYFLFKKSWKAIAVSSATLLVALLLSAALFGLEPLTTFVASNPTSRVPGYVYGELINQSLIGMLVRRDTGVLRGSLFGEPLYLGIATLLALASAWVLRRGDAMKRDHGLGLCLMLALLVYPATLAHYSLVIIAPLLALWRDRRSLPLGPGGVIALAAVVYAILGWDRFESHNFWANLLMWGTLAGACWHLSVRPTHEVVVPARP
jgi:hypothetical protein